MQVQIFAQRFACIVKPLSDTKATAVRIDADFHPVKPFAVGIMAGGVATARNIGPIMRSEGEPFLDAEAGGVADNLLVIFDDKLPFRKGGQLAAQHAGRVASHLRVGPVYQTVDGVNIIQRRQADDQLGFFRFGHSRTVRKWRSRKPITMSPDEKFPAKLE